MIWRRSNLFLAMKPDDSVATVPPPVSDGSSVTPAMTLDAFERLARSRRATRHFKSDRVPQELLNRIIEIAHWAPSGYNLQPTHYTVVADPSLREELYVACMSQRPVLEAPALMVISGDRDVAEKHLEPMLAAEKAAGSIKPAYEALLRRVVPLAFKRGPLGLNRLWKATLLPIVRWFKPIPDLPAVDMRYWLAKQTAMSAMNLMLAAEAAGLATLPMEGFDERRVRRVLRMPRSHLVTLIVAVGWSTDAPRSKTRLPVGEVVTGGRWVGANVCQSPRHRL